MPTKISNSLNQKKTLPYPVSKEVHSVFSQKCHCRFQVEVNIQFAANPKPFAKWISYVVIFSSFKMIFYSFGCQQVREKYLWVSEISREYQGKNFPVPVSNNCVNQMNQISSSLPSKIFFLFHFELPFSF